MSTAANSGVEPDARELAGRLASDGFVLLPERLSAVRSQSILDVSRRRSRAVHQALGSREIGIGSAAGYIEIVQRSPRRWDVPMTPQQFGIDEREMPWWGLVALILGEDAEHSFCGVVSAEPGSPAQCWHTDSPHVAAEHLPPHAVNVFLALHDVPMVMGPTEFARGSHVLTNHLGNPSLEVRELIYQSTRTSPESLLVGTGHALPARCASPMATGSCLVFDDRLLHRGLGNQSAKTRHVAYFSYRRKGYAENTHFESRRSVFDADA